MTDQLAAEATPSPAPAPAPPTPPDGLDYEAIVIGAGVGGIYQIKRLVDLGISATVLDANADVGGTWFNNRYPGARFDSESYTYGYSWSEELLEEWDWTEHFSPQPETLRYLSHVADKFDLRQHMQFECTVEAMDFDEATDAWTLSLNDGRSLTCRYVLMAVGLLSVPTMPRIEGVESFEGPAFHPFDWPHDGIDLTDKRVAIIGTGATAIQIIPEVAKQAGHLTVFQRRPNWAAPLNNDLIDPEEMAEIKSRYDEIFAACAESPAAFEHTPDRRGIWNVTDEERFETWDRLYGERGFGIWLQNFVETFSDERANGLLCEFIADRIRDRVDDPELAEKLIPTDHGFGVQRLPLETGYYETYNRDDVTLVDAKATPIERITPTGIRTTERDYDFDVIVYSTGFDAFTGAFDRIDITGVSGTTLRDKWRGGPVTYLGMLAHGFPNFVMIPGPQVAVGNFPRTVEMTIDFATPLIEHTRAAGYTRFDADEAAERDWFDQVVASYEPFLIRNAQSWITGYNSNLDGHEFGNTRYNVYNGGFPKFRAMLDDLAANGYGGVTFSRI